MRKIENKIPCNLEESFDQLMRGSKKEDLDKFIDGKEDDVCLYHHGCGTNLRNNWGLWTEDSPLVKFFNSIGIYHADDMSNIIFTSFHRFMNNKDMKLNEQVKHYQNYWKNVGFKNGNPLDDSEDNYTKGKQRFIIVKK